MRILLTIFLCAAILSGVWLFTTQRPAPAPVQAEDSSVDTGEVAGLVLEVYATAALGADPFALDAAAQTALTVRQAEEVLLTLEQVAPLEIITEPLPPLPRQRLELLLAATPVVGEPSPRQGLQVRILQQGALLAETTAWTEGGLPITAVLPLDLRHAQ